jgi:EAL domain-containing protein (putative c-di-GMP-specific phosphodiesterase class I)
LSESGVPAHLIELELTESGLMAVSREHNDVLVRLRQAGHRIAIDDFGAGYSSLDYLRRYPVDRIKIAEDFVVDLGKVAGIDMIVRAAIGLARELGIEVLVEGVETAAQLELLRSWGARIVQGYYFAKPLSVEDTTALLRLGSFAQAARNLRPEAART